MEYYFHKPDMDTVLTALILGWQRGDALICVPCQAPSWALSDPRRRCIECGGSGQAHLGNYDHHGPSALPPACLQAFHAMRYRNPVLRQLAQYVAAVDTGNAQPLRTQAGFTLSNIFSGLRLTHKTEREQFRAGIALFEKVLELKINPWGSMPALAEWTRYREAKNHARADLCACGSRVVCFTTNTGLTGGFLECKLPGVHGFLRSLGCRVSVAAGLQSHGVRLVTIAGVDLALNGLSRALNAVEPGWSGQAAAYIIGSPRAGTRIAASDLIDIIRKIL